MYGNADDSTANEVAFGPKLFELNLEGTVMRCTKCGYISFDKVETCSKCAASLVEISEKISGTVQKVEAPAFLVSVIGVAGGAALIEDDQDIFSSQETEFDLAGAVDEEALEENVAEVDVASDEGLEIDMGAEEREVPSIDLSQFDEGQGEAVDEEASADVEFDMDSGDEADENASIDFQMEEEAGSEPQAELFEEGEEVEGGIDFELEEQSESITEIDEEGGLYLELDSESELSLDEPSVQKSEPEPAPESGISLDLDVDLEDEPEEDEMVFNLEDIDMSDLVIEEGVSQEGGSVPAGEDAAHDLEDFLADGGDGSAELQLDDIPMDLSLEDGELLEDDSGKSQEEESQDSPESEL